MLYAGGAVEELATCAEGAGISAVYTLVNGEYVSYILGAPDLVNRPFAELFADGLPGVTPLVVRSEAAPATGRDR